MNLLGKRYHCVNCDGEVVCTKPGGGTLQCCGTAMAVKEAKPLPSSD